MFSCTNLFRCGLLIIVVLVAYVKNEIKPTGTRTTGGDQEKTEEKKAEVENEFKATGNEEFNTDIDQTELQFGKAKHQFKPGSKGEQTMQMLGYSQDVLWPDQWYMTEDPFFVNGIRYAPSMSLVQAHKRKIKGKLVHVVIVGNNPVNFHHHDFAEANFKTKMSKNLGVRDKVGVFYNRYLSTAAAGIIGMRGGNLFCGVGAMPECTFSSITVDSMSKVGVNSPEYEVQDLTVRYPSIDIFVHVWVTRSTNPFTDLIGFRYNGDFLHQYNDRGEPNSWPVKIQVMGSGDNGAIGNTCQCNAYASIPDMFVFSSVGYDGRVTDYSESGASVVGCTYSSTPGDKFFNNIVTVAVHSRIKGGYAPLSTSVSAAFGASAIGLMMDLRKEKSPQYPLERQDIMFLLATCGDNSKLNRSGNLWLQNAMGVYYSHETGFGLPNLSCLLDKTLLWNSVGRPFYKEFVIDDRHEGFECSSVSVKRHFNLFAPNMRMKLHFSKHNPLQCTIPINVNSTYRLEQISVTFTAQLANRGSLLMYLISPSETIVAMMEGRVFDNSKDGYNEWTVRTPYFIGEPISGNWLLRIYNLDDNSIMPSQVTKESPKGENKPSLSYLSYLKLHIHGLEPVQGFSFVARSRTKYFPTFAFSKLHKFILQKRHKTKLRYETNVSSLGIVESDPRISDNIEETSVENFDVKGFSQGGQQLMKELNSLNKHELQQILNYFLPKFRVVVEDPHAHSHAGIKTAKN